MLGIITTQEATTLVQTFNWHTPSWDLFILLIWGVGSILYAFSAGRGRIISMLMSLYISKLLVSEAPWITQAVNEKLTGSLIGLQQLVSFLLIFLVLFIFLSRFAFKTSADGRHLASIPFAIVFSILQIGLLIQNILAYLSATGKEFSALVTAIFLVPGASFFWLLAPLVFLILLGHFISDRSEV
jgi:cation transport ATPase